MTGAAFTKLSPGTVTSLFAKYCEVVTSEFKGTVALVELIPYVAIAKVSHDAMAFPTRGPVRLFLFALAFGPLS